MDTITDHQAKEYSIVRLNNENIHDLLKLYRHVYSSSISRDYFQKKYDTVYIGIENIGFLAYRNDEPIAYYGVIPCFIEFQGKKILAAQSADTMTHPGFRYKGMFVELSNKTFDLCRQSGIKLAFGFPNQNSYHGAVNKLGWIETEKMNCFTIPVNSLPVESVLKKLKLAKLYNKYRNLVFQKNTLPLAGVDNSVIADGYAGVYRGKEYLSYKTFSKTRVIEIDNAKIWVSEKPGFQIGDIQNVNENNFLSTIDRLKSLAKRAGVNYIQFHCCKNTNLHRLFSSKYKSSESFPVLFQDFGSSIPIQNIKFTLADIDIF